MIILGLSAYFHDSSAAIIIDGQVIAAATEERFTRKKHDNSFPTNACVFCLEYSRVKFEEIDEIVFFEKPFIKFERILRSHIQYAPKGVITFVKTLPIWLKNKLNMRDTIRRELNKTFGYNPKIIRFSEHHLSHASIAYYLSGYENAGVLVIDAVGENATTSIFKGHDGKLTKLMELSFPQSLGLLYSAFTQFLGFEVNSDEYKVMGLAPYGNSSSKEVDEYIRIIKNTIISINGDGSFVLNENYFTFMYGMRMINKRKWEKLFSVKSREYNDDILQEHCNIAYAIQRVTTEILNNLVLHTIKLTNCNNVCITGGCALNCSAIGDIIRENISANVFVPFAPDDSGCSIGAALALYYSQKPIVSKVSKNPYTGNSYSDIQVEKSILNYGLHYKYMVDFNKLCTYISNQISNQKVVGWFQGRMEFGPRALGNRSILADPRRKEMKKHVNSVIKHRESFRPFAPAIMEEYKNMYFNIKDNSPFMMSTFYLKQDKRYLIEDSLSLDEKIIIENSPISAVTHIDWTSRLQTVSKNDNYKFYSLLLEFYRLTGCPMLLNTSFNVMGEPIVCSPEDALKTFVNSGIDILVMNNYIIEK